MSKEPQTTPEQFAADLERVLRRAPEGSINIEQLDKAAALIRARDDKQFSDGVLSYMEVENAGK